MLSQPPPIPAKPAIAAVRMVVASSLRGAYDWGLALSTPARTESHGVCPSVAAVVPLSLARVELSPLRLAARTPAWVCVLTVLSRAPRDDTRHGTVPEHPANRARSAGRTAFLNLGAP